MAWAWLHMHSTASDGLDTPEAIVQRAQQSQVAACAITDHDTLHGFQRIAAFTTPTIIGGVELSVWDSQFHIWGHLTVLFPATAQTQIAELAERSHWVRHHSSSSHLPDIKEVAAIPCVILSGCHGSILYKVGTTPFALGAVLASWKTLFAHRLYIEVQPSFGPFDERLYTWLTTMLHIPLIVTTDTHGTPQLDYYSEAAIRAFHPSLLWQRGVTQTAYIAQHLQEL